MARISLDALKARLEGREFGQSTEAERRSGMLSINARESLECSLGGVAAILNIALLDRAIEGFPNVIPLGSEASGGVGVHLERIGLGFWHINGETKTMLTTELDDPNRGFALGAVLSAIGVDENEVTLRSLDAVADWSGEPVDVSVKLASVAADLPNHVLFASLGWGTELLQALGQSTTEEMALTWAETVRSLGVNLDEPPLPWKTPATVAACDRGDTTMLHGLMRAGASIEARDGHGFTPLLATVRHGRFYGIKPCMEWNADVAAQTNDGRTALHCAAEAAAEGCSENADGTFRLLLELGCDPDTVNDAGLKASEILEAALRNPNGQLDARAIESIGQALERLSEHTAAISPGL